MKKALLFLALVAGLVAAPRVSLALPTLTDAEFRMNQGQVRGPGVMLGYQVVSNKVQMLKCKLDVAVQGGSTAAAINLKAVDGSNCLLPNKAIVWDGVVDVVTAPTSVGSATIAFSTGQSAGDLKADTAKASWTGRVALIPVGTAAAAIKLTANRNPTALVKVADITTGKFNVYIHYMLGE